MYPNLTDILIGLYVMVNSKDLVSTVSRKRNFVDQSITKDVDLIQFYCATERTLKLS